MNRPDFTDDFPSPPEERRQQRLEQFQELLIMLGLSGAIILMLVVCIKFIWRWLPDAH